tara:strand:- start:5365 stop:6558 length:1194 start_codon:yes stop_codon:yes gene_type:complete
MSNDSSASLEEAKLRNELLRIRNTYSFRLGLLITEAFFRKPWLILVFPYLFMKMNIDFLRNRKNFSASSNHETLGTYNSECILLFVASEGGRAACERAKEMANEWLSEYRNHLVIVSSNTGLVGFNQPNLSLYMIPDPKSKENISRSQWNKSCENTMFRAIYTHLPRLFIFDGPYPYRGVLNAIDSAPDMESVWIQSERTSDEVVTKAAPYFTKMKKMNYLEDNQLSANKNKRTYHSLTNKILLATGYGSHEGSQKIPRHVLNSLSNYENIHLIGVKNSAIPDQSSRYTELWDEIIENPNMNKLQAAVVSDNVELITKLHSLMIPTLCILHKNTTKEVNKLIKSLASSGTLFVSEWNEKEEIELYIQALLNREWNLSISQRGTIQNKSTVISQFIHS